MHVEYLKSVITQRVANRRKTWKKKKKKKKTDARQNETDQIKQFMVVVVFFYNKLRNVKSKMLWEIPLEGHA